MQKPFDVLILNFAQQDDIANAATPQAQVQVSNEYDFELTEITGVINGATDVTGPLLVELVLSGGLNIQENPLDMFSFSKTSGAFQETAAKPITIPWSGAIIQSATKITAKWNNQSGQTLSFQLILVGRKIFH